MAKSWAQRLASGKPAHVEVLQKPYGGAPQGAKMLIATPRMVDDYMRNLPPGSRRTIAQMRTDLATAHGADLSCPISTSIFARIAAEVALEELEAGKQSSEVTPFWRAIGEDSPVAKRLSCGPAFIRMRRDMEGR